MPTHGSLAKAGKVRSQTPKMTATPKKSRIPRLRSRRNYEKRIILQRNSGQNWGDRGRRRGRRR
ncbi:MAG: 30S ribosomal protein S30e [Candidatus Bathyarchaeota archaeon]|nr:30S ribosomal protein S30e [Candidatus Bathyarchaeota archaeon]MDH5635810.1 30S ribosomal protein S30e [Candidatus Bathyarchaeota archaeon]MDH5702116.1 30S ribosomal protein S30e [Candidatus Bathyarchaeota archaeon]